MFSLFFFFFFSIHAIVLYMYTCVPFILFPAARNQCHEWKARVTSSAELSNERAFLERLDEPEALHLSLSLSLSLSYP